MIIQINEKYRITSDSRQWMIQKHQERGDDREPWVSISYFPTFKMTLSELGERILRRASFGAPKAWGSIELSPTAEAEYRRILYDNNLDLLFHRICYWCDGRRTLLDIVQRLEFEMEELMRDTAISRINSDMSNTMNRLIQFT